MNLVQFLKKVDDNVSNMTKEQLQCYVLELARTLPENKRQYFLEVMNVIQKESTLAPKEDIYEDLYAQIAAVKENLENVNDGERCLDSCYNEEWDDWYNSDVEEILFSDPEKLIEDIEEAIELLHKCVDREAYKEGCELAEVLSVLEVFSTGNYNDIDGTPLGIEELYYHNLLNGSFENVVRESLYLCYMGNELSFRAEELYCMMSNYHCYEVTLEDIMQYGKQELPEFNEFLPLWIGYLGSQTERGAKELLQEALSMLEDENQMLGIAREFADQHPELYKQLLQNGLEHGEKDRMLQIGLEALDHIPVSHVIRSEIALLTAEFACKMQDRITAELCWVEAFRSDTSGVNYMRIRFMAKNWKQYDIQIKQIYSELYEKSKQKNNADILGRHHGSAQRVNTLYLDTYCVLRFFDGDFKNVIQLGLSEKDALGWSFTFMKEGLSLFLLLLYQERTLSKGMNAMLERVVSACGFRLGQFLKGTGISMEKQEKEVFWELFCKWKTEIEISEQEQNEWIQMIEKFISIRTAGIMEANRRNYYGECAAFIAAYGEVCESRGVRGAKAAVMGKYKAVYSRRRAFHQELRDFGMRG